MDEKSLESFFDETTSEVVYTVDQDSSKKTLYWVIPPQFLGNKV
jgi:hypothetical protein